MLKPFDEDCRHCGCQMRVTNSTRSHANGIVIFRSWLCPDCGAWLESRQIRNEDEEVLLSGQPRAVVEGAAQERMEAEAAGHKEFFAKARGRRIQ